MFRQTRRRRARFKPTRVPPSTSSPPADALKRAFPVPQDGRFNAFLNVLDRAFFEPYRGVGHQSGKGAAPRRVLPLAILAVIVVLVLARAASATAWELAGERYADEVVNELQNARTTPAVN